MHKLKKYKPMDNIKTNNPAYILPPQRVAVVGLGYVGLPLAVLFSKVHQVVGYDLNARLVEAIRTGHDATGELSDKRLQSALESGRLHVTSRQEDLRDSNIYVVAVPTPVDHNLQPDAGPLISASRSVGCVLKKGDIVIYESTVYPGMTEEVCVPVLENVSGMTFNRDFFVGYSPERINPGDKVHTIEKIQKVTSGSTPDTLRTVNALYANVLEAGTFPVSSIKVAEATKIIENTQRDVNIAFMNEVTKILNAVGVDTEEVLSAAETKWNFIQMKPGLVGGHCIGVDPYYLIRCAMGHGINARLIREARETNEGMAAYWVDRIIRRMSENDILLHKATILLIGFTFKANSGDTRNTKIYNVYQELLRYSHSVLVYDPLADATKVKAEYGIDLLSDDELDQLTGKIDTVVHCVAHNATANIDTRRLLAPGGIVMDVTSSITKN